jgi:hypothetical protein
MPFFIRIWKQGTSLLKQSRAETAESSARRFVTHITAQAFEYPLILRRRNKGFQLLMFTYCSPSVPPKGLTFVSLIEENVTV